MSSARLATCGNSPHHRSTSAANRKTAREMLYELRTHAENALVKVVHRIMDLQSSPLAIVMESSRKTKILAVLALAVVAGVVWFAASPRDNKPAVVRQLPAKVLAVDQARNTVQFLIKTNDEERDEVLTLRTNDKTEVIVGGQLAILPDLKPKQDVIVTMDKGVASKIKGLGRRATR